MIDVDVDVDVDVVSPSGPWWTPEREQAFVLTLQGVPQHQVAAELQRDRHTVARWAEDDRFTQRLFDENASRFKASRQRRAMQTLRLTDKAEHLATSPLCKQFAPWSPTSSSTRGSHCSGTTATCWRSTRSARAMRSTS